MKQILTLFITGLLISGCSSHKDNGCDPLYCTSESCCPKCSEIADARECVESVGDPNSQQKALVIGNANYSYKALLYPINDARDMTKTLVDLGFYVVRAQNLRKRTMNWVINDFNEHLPDLKVAFFYFSGHGAQTGKVNYLIPTNNSTISREGHLEKRAISEAKTLAMMKTRNEDGVNIFVIDACRDEPYKGGGKSLRNGLAALEVSGTIIGHAAEDGQQAFENDESGNGLYTSYLLKALKRAKHKPIDEVFKKVAKPVFVDSLERQTPSYKNLIIGDFCFGGCR